MAPEAPGQTPTGAGRSWALFKQAPWEMSFALQLTSPDAGPWQSSQGTGLIFHPIFTSAACGEEKGASAGSCGLLSFS